MNLFCISFEKFKRGELPWDLVIISVLGIPMHILGISYRAQPVDLPDAYLSSVIFLTSVLFLLGRLKLRVQPIVPFPVAYALQVIRISLILLAAELIMIYIWAEVVQQLNECCGLLFEKLASKHCLHGGMLLNIFCELFMDFALACASLTFVLQKTRFFNTFCAADVRNAAVEMPPTVNPN